MPDVNAAVTLIRTGQKEEAQAILKEIIRTEPHNIPAWFWMVETLETNANKLRVMEVCRKLNPKDSKVEKAYNMLKEVQEMESEESAQEPKPAEGSGIEKEIPAAPFAEVSPIQAAPGQFVPPPEPVKEEPKPPEAAAAAFAAVQVVQNAPGQFTPPPKVAEEHPGEAAVAVAAISASGGAAETPSFPSSLPGGKKETPPFVDENLSPAVPLAAAAAVAPLEPIPAEAHPQKPRRKRSWKWLLPAIAISFLVFLCAGISFIYIRQLFS